MRYYVLFLLLLLGLTSLACSSSSVTSAPDSTVKVLTAENDGGGLGLLIGQELLVVLDPSITRTSSIANAWEIAEYNSAVMELKKEEWVDFPSQDLGIWAYAKQYYWFRAKSPGSCVLKFENVGFGNQVLCECSFSIQVSTEIPEDIFM